MLFVDQYSSTVAITNKSSSPRVSVRRVVPFSANKTWNMNSRCYLGVSLDTAFIQEGRQKVVLRWLADNFSEPALLVGDSLHRLTLQTRHKVNEVKASKMATMMGDDFLEKSKDLLGSLIYNRFQIFRCSEISQTSLYKLYYEQVCELRRSNKEFDHSVNSDACTFVERQKRNNKMTHCSYQEPIKFSGRYILEEIAIYACLAKNGWFVEAYPGDELPTLVKINEGQFPGMPESLRKRINLSLKIKL